MSYPTTSHLTWGRFELEGLDDGGDDFVEDRLVGLVEDLMDLVTTGCEEAGPETQVES